MINEYNVPFYILFGHFLSKKPVPNFVECEWEHMSFKKLSCYFKEAGNKNKNTTIGAIQYAELAAYVVTYITYIMIP